jgi:alginate O-acetyltransferase complex protein AlgI
MANALERPLIAQPHRLDRGWPFLIPLAATWLAIDQRPWIAMWLLTLAWYFAFKLWTLLKYAESAVSVPARTAIAYLLLWPGMNAAAFCVNRNLGSRTAAADWILASVNVGLGAAAFWGLARWFTATSDLLAGWIGLVGLALMLHFGIAHFATLAWRVRRVDVEPLMNWPLAARSVSDFWSHRWNLAFRDLAQVLVFRPLLRKIGPSGATFSVFAVSGLVHDAVISLAARAGYGLPTLYFLGQGCAVLLEKSDLGRRWKLNRGSSGRIFAWIVVAPGAFFLFHPPFIRAVVLPMMHAVGAV